MMESLLPEFGFLLQRQNNTWEYLREKCGLCKTLSEALLSPHWERLAQRSVWVLFEMCHLPQSLLLLLPLLLAFPHALQLLLQVGLGLQQLLHLHTE